ncbi:MAG: hypothetical protein H5T34_00795 [Candidatus Methanomethyliales bacterium]|nr:hypothetical protein [Candidatus Methanomethylicales archaeon]
MDDLLFLTFLGAVLFGHYLGMYLREQDVLGMILITALFLSFLLWILILWQRRDAVKVQPQVVWRDGK